MTKSALVSGAGRGIGRAVALRLAEEGYDVTAMARTESELAETVAAMNAAGSGRALAVIGDVTREADAEAAVSKTLESFGRIDLLVNNAGLFKTAPLVETTTELWESVINTNLKGAFFLTRSAARAMIQQGDGGFVVNVSSTAGKQGYPGSAAYCASKFGLGGFSAAIREEFRDHGIRVILVCPGAVDTRAWDQCGLDLDAIGIQRDTMMQPGEVADAIWFAVGRDGQAAPEEILLTPRCGA